MCLTGKPKVYRNTCNAGHGCAGVEGIEEKKTTKTVRNEEPIEVHFESFPTTNKKLIMVKVTGQAEVAKLGWFNSFA